MASALKLAAFMARKGWSRAFKEGQGGVVNRQYVTLISIQQGQHRPFLMDFDVEKFDPRAYDEDKDTA